MKVLYVYMEHGQQQFIENSCYGKSFQLNGKYVNNFYGRF